jgi:hypothetical protein
MRFRRKPKGVATGVKMDVTATIKRSAAIAIGVAGLIVVLLLFWIGGEMHYRNCLEEVGLKSPVALTANSAVTAQREAAINDCSRWP